MMDGGGLGGPWASKYSHLWCGTDPPSYLDEYFKNKTEKNGLDMRAVYRFEGNRLHSYSTWPDKSVVFPTSLARTGLYYTGNSDTVECFACGVKIGQWEKGDLPITEHQKHSPRCPFLLGGDVGNVPLETSNGKFDLASLKDNEGNILKAREIQTENIVKNVISTSEIEMKMDQLFNKYKCSSLDWTRAQKLRSELLKPAEDLIKKNGFHKNGYQPALTEKSGAKSLTYGMSNVTQKDKNNCSSTGHHSLGEEFDSEAVSPPTFPKNETGRDTCPDITQRDAVSVPAVTQISNGQSSRPSPMQPPRRTECDATTFTLPSGAPNIISIQSRIINIPVFQGLTEYCSKEDLLNLLRNAHSAQNAHINDRYNSFESWPLTTVQDPRALAEAGFYYTGQEDRVRCFMCNGGLCNWESTDTPWYEHNKWFGRCQYVMKAKKHEVVKVIIETAAQLNNAEIDDSEPEWFQPSTRHSHANLPRGIQCDCRLGSVPYDFWRSSTIKQVYDMGFTRYQVESAVERDGVGITNSLESVVEALTSDIPLYQRQRQRNQTETDLAPIIQNTAPDRSLNVVQRDRDEEEVENTEVTPLETKTETVPDPTSKSNPPGLSDIEKENEELKTTRICKICLDTMVQVIFLPCSHLVSCLECSLQLEKCPVCRERIKATARVYL